MTDTAGVRPQGPEAVSAALVDAAIELLAARGPSRVTVAEIARTAGVNHGQVHHYFDGKRGLLAAAMQHVVQEHWDTVSRDLASVTRPDMSGRYWSVLARVLLDGELGLAERAHRAGPSVPQTMFRAVSAVSDRPSDEIRVPLVVVSLLTVGLAAFGPFFRDQIDLSDGDYDRVLPGVVGRIVAFELGRAGLADVEPGDQREAWRRSCEQEERAVREHGGGLAGPSPLHRDTRPRTPAPTNKPRGTAEVREALVVATAGLLPDLGAQQLTAKIIAERAGVNHGQIHHLFGGKRALVLAGMSRINHDQWNRVMAEGVAAVGAGRIGEAAYRATGRAVLDGDDELAQLARDEGVSVLRFLYEVLRERVAPGIDADRLPELQAGMVAFAALGYGVAIFGDFLGGEFGMAPGTVATEVSAETLRLQHDFGRNVGMPYVDEWPENPWDLVDDPPRSGT